MEKTCTRCKILKDISFFIKQKTGKFGVASYCKSCNVERNREYKKRIRERVYTIDDQIYIMRRKIQRLQQKLNNLIAIKNGIE